MPTAFFFFEFVKDIALARIVRSTCVAMAVVCYEHMCGGFGDGLCFEALCVRERVCTTCVCFFLALLHKKTEE